MNGSLETLEVGQTLLTTVRGVNFTDVNAPKVQVEFAELIDTPAGSENPLALLNADDARFSQKKPRRAWMTVSPVKLKEYFDIDIDMSTMSVDNVVDVNLLNPEIKGKRLHVQITESVTPDEYQLANAEATAKRKGKEGALITHNGNLIFSNTDVVFGTPKHTFLESDTVENTVEEGAHSVSLSSITS